MTHAIFYCHYGDLSAFSAVGGMEMNLKMPELAFERTY